MKNSKRIGIYPGTFDPIHEGHIAFALEAAKKCRLDKVVFMPESAPRGKHNVSSLAIRTKQITDKIKTYPNLDMFILDQLRFTVDNTLPLLQSLYPHCELTLLVGSDVAQNLGSWPNIGKLASVVSFAVGARDSESSATLNSQLQSLQLKFKVIQTAHGHLSSTKIRAAS